MIGWITNTTVETNFFMEIFGPVIDWIIAIGIIMIFTFAFLIIKAIYKIFFKGIYIRLKYRDADIATLSNVGILNPDEIKKDLTEQLFYFEENIKISKNDNLKSIADDRLIHSYERRLDRLADYREDVFFKEPELLYCAIYNCEKKGIFDYVDLKIILKVIEYKTDARNRVKQGSKYFKRKKYYNVRYQKKSSYDTNYNCPNCNALIKSSNISYCGNCGIKITNIDGWKLMSISCDTN